MKTFRLESIIFAEEKRNFWQYSVKVAVATLGVSSLALGVAALPVLYISSVILFANYFINNNFADVQQSKFSFSNNKIPSSEITPADKIHLQQKIKFWQNGVEQHQLKLENNNIQNSTCKVCGALVLSYALFIILKRA